MDSIKIFLVNFIKIIGYSIVSCFLGIPIILYFAFHSFFEYIGNDYSQSTIYTFISIGILLIIITAIFTIKVEDDKRKEYWSDKEKSFLLSEEFRKQEWDKQDNNRKQEWERKGNEIKADYDKVLQVKSYLEKMMEEEQQYYPWFSQLFADFMYVVDKDTINKLKQKHPPARVAAEQVSAIAKEKRELQKLCKMYQYQLNYYENIFPWLEDFKEVDPKEAWHIVHNSDDEALDEYSKVRNWLSPEEFNNLTQEEKWQLALDRYRKKRKTNWEIGIDYERYIGFKFEQEGYKVRYHGALHGLEDMGRDLIVTNKNEITVIQCKRWSSEKTVHEKHIFQLYGSVVLMQIQNPKKHIKGLFVTTTILSDKAKECSEFLNIEVYEKNAYIPYPMIKCNNSKLNGKIYHLPFDQQYDSVQINTQDGDCYVNSVKEAEALGYRHAFRWRGE